MTTGTHLQMLSPPRPTWYNNTGKMRKLNIRILRKRAAILVTAGIIGIAAAALQFVHGQQNSTPEREPENCILLSFGWRQSAPEFWQGRVSAAGGRPIRVQGWRIKAHDSLTPDGTWRIKSIPETIPAREIWPGAACAQEDDSLTYFARHPDRRVGLLVYGSRDAQLHVETESGNFDVDIASLRYGQPVRYLDGSAHVELVTAAGQPDQSSPEQDYPSLAAARDGTLWLAYQSYDVSLHQDRILLTALAHNQWSPPQQIADGGIYYRPQIAIDAAGRVWIVWAQLVNENWELLARQLSSGSLSEPQRIASSVAGSWNQRLIAAPDGRLWLAWQGNRNGHWDIFLAHLDGDRWSEPDTVSSGPHNNWDPALATTKDGRVVVAWDSFRHGSFNVYMRILANGKWEPETPVASGETFEAHAALAVDPQDTIWIAWDDGGPDWGFDSACNGLYRERHVDVRAYANGAWKMPLVKPMRDLPLVMSRFVSLPQIEFDGQGRLWMLFRHWSSRTVYEFYAMYLTGAGWSSPTIIPNSTGREHQHIATAIAADGRLWAAWSTDNVGPGELKLKHYSVEAAELPVPAIAPASNPLQRGTPPLNITVDAPYEPPRYSTAVDGKKLSVYWGDMHRHTDVSSHRFTDGSIEATYRYGTDVARLDFLAPTDHVDIGTPTSEYIHGDDYNWWRIEKAADLFRMPKIFIPVYAYERSMASPGGHRNLLYLKRGAVPIPGNVKDPRSNDPVTLWEKLAGLQDVLVFPHTPGDVMQPLITWTDRKPDYESLVEIYQGLRSSYEYRNAPPDGKLGNTQTDEPGHFYQDALAKGLRYGVEASSDHLATHKDFTGVYSGELSRPALFRALKARHTFAASDKIIVDFRMDGHLMGDEIHAARPPEAVVKVIGTGQLRRVDIVRNGVVVYTQSPSAARVDFRYQDASPAPGENYYYIRVRQEDGNMAWSSPIWVLPPGSARQ